MALNTYALDSESWLLNTITITEQSRTNQLKQQFVSLYFGGSWFHSRPRHHHILTELYVSLALATMMMFVS